MLKRLLSLVAMVACAVASGAPKKIGPDVPSTGGNVNVIVRFVHPPTKDELKLLGPYGQIKKHLDVINAVHISLSPQQIQALSSNPVIAYISPDRPMTGSLDVTTQTVNANLAWQFGYDGTGVGVAVIDSGISLKHDFNNKNGVTTRLVYSQNFVETEDATDRYGHGTHVAGIVGGNGTDSTGSQFSRTFRGVAPNVNLVSLKVLDQNGAGTESDVIAAIQTAISLKSTYNIRVMNMSLGRPVFESYTLDPLCQAVEAAYRAGIVVVVAAGNYGRDNTRGTRGYGTIASPGNDPYVITVGATNAKGTASPYDDSIASYSAKGPTLVDHLVKPDIVAPGNGVVSVLASTQCTLFTQFNSTHVSNYYDLLGGSGVNGNYFKLSGTSMATPVVAGAVALLLQKNPALTPDQVKERLMRSARKMLPKYMFSTDALTFAQFTASADIFTVGAGYLDINAALANTDLITTSAMSPVVTYNTLTHKAGLGNSFAKIMGLDDSVVWGDTLVSLVGGVGQVLWAADDSVVWGDSTNGAFSVIWGDTILLNLPPVAMTDDDSDTDQ
jgi:serine protease AprX